MPSNIANNEVEDYYKTVSRESNFRRSKTVKDQSKEAVKYLGIYLDQSLNFQEEVKNILRKMAMGIKTLNVIKHPFPVSTRILLMNALILSHLHYSSVVIQGISNNLTVSLEKQLSWAVKSCFNRKKIGSSADLKLKFGI